MTAGPQYLIALFDSVSHVLRAEKLLKAGAVSYKIIPVPRQLSSDCGVCIRITPDQREVFIKALGSEGPAYEIRELLPAV